MIEGADTLHRTMQPIRQPRRQSDLVKMLRIASLTAAATLVTGIPPAVGSCLPPMPIEQALRESGSVFVGTVVGLADADRTANFDVDEVWVGPDLPARAVVHGGPEGDTFTSVDRTWEANGRYLVFASVVDGQLTDNACSNTQSWSDELEALRPPDAQPPEAATDSGTTGGLPATALVVIGGLVALGLVSVLAFRRGPA